MTVTLMGLETRYPLKCEKKCPHPNKCKFPDDCPWYDDFAIEQQSGTTSLDDILDEGIDVLP